MTTPSYLQFLQTSELFQNLKPALQKKMLAAVGKDREDNFSLLSLGHQDLLAAKKKFIAGSAEAVKGMSEKTKRAQKNFMAASEVTLQKGEMARVEKLMKTL